MTKTRHQAVRALVLKILALLFGIVLVLSLCHLLYSDLRIGRVSWFDLDAERNLPTWFSGTLFFLFSVSAMAAYYWEGKRNGETPRSFHLPVLWWGVALVGLLMSLDEMTILHENLFWREVRLATSELGGAWKYLTHWQLFLAPAMLVVLVYLIVFFSNRFGVSRSGQRWAFGGIACWIGSQVLEAVRGTFREAGDAWYTGEVLAEELLEMFGAVLLLGAIVFYVVDIALDFDAKKRERLQVASGLLTRRALAGIGTLVLLLSASGGAAYYLARRQADSGAPVPRLVRNAVGTESPGRQSSEIWFEDLQGTVPVSAADGAALARASLQAVVSKQEASLDGLSDALKKDANPRVLFLTISDGRRMARVFTGTGHGAVQAAAAAISRVRGLGDDFQPKWLKLDIVENVSPMSGVDLLRPIPLDRSLQGLALENGSGIALLPEELLLRRLVKKDGRVREGNLRRYFRHRFAGVADAPTLGRTSNRTVHRFEASSYFADATATLPLYRGHRTFDTVSPDELLDAAVRGGGYLESAVDHEGVYVYNYRPKTDDVSKSYNILRHAGTAYSMLEVHRAAPDAELLAATVRALDHLMAQADDCPGASGQSLCIVEEGAVKLGGNALAIVALAELTRVTGERRYLAKAQRLAAWMLSVQDAGGEFTVHKLAFPSGKVVPFESGYYPGEALLALVRLYSVDKDEKWLDGAEKGARYLIEVRDMGVPESKLNHDHWLLYALNELYRQRPKPLYLEHAMKITRAIVQSQNRTPHYPDWLGSYYRPPRSTPTATRTEGLCAAYQLARDFRTAEEAKVILDAMLLGVRFQLQTQFRPESVLYVEDPPRSLGGFHRSLTDFSIRIDYVQHNISSLLCLRNVMARTED